jgi:uncharacterized protein (TIGR02217 family)
MAFLNSVFPLELAAIDSQDTWEDVVVKLGGGGEQRAILWSDSKRMYNANAAENISIPTLGSLRKHFNAMRARGFSFPLRDRSFFRATTEAFGVGDGSTTAFQLSINDGDSSNAYNREIHLIDNAPSIFDNASPVTEGAGAGKFTVPYSGATAGLVTFGTAPVTGHILTWTGTFYIPVRYDTKSFPSAELFIWRSDNTGLAKGPDLPMIEVRYPSEFA